jgi:dephospho-CoA kinase
LKNKLLIGITGAFGSGKSSAADFFLSKGFKKITLSDFLEEELKKQGKTQITRKLLQDIGNKLREEFGSGILAKKALEYVGKKNINKAVIDGIRNTEEINEFRKQENYVQLGILADRKIRFKRLKELKRREELTWDLFEKLDSRDLGIGEAKSGLQVAFCITLSDAFITNNKTKEDFEESLSQFLKTVL